MAADRERARAVEAQAEAARTTAELTAEVAAQSGGRVPPTANWLRVPPPVVAPAAKPMPTSPAKAAAPPPAKAPSASAAANPPNPQPSGSWWGQADWSWGEWQSSPGSGWGWAQADWSSSEWASGWRSSPAEQSHGSSGSWWSSPSTWASATHEVSEEDFALLQRLKNALKAEEEAKQGQHSWSSSSWRR